jgi:hypothetical protein
MAQWFFDSQMSEVLINQVADLLRLNVWIGLLIVAYSFRRNNLLQAIVVFQLVLAYVLPVSLQGRRTHRRAYI